MVHSTTLRSLLILLGIAVLAATSCSRAPAVTGASIPRTADGKPNLQGIWQVRNRASYDLEEHVARLGMPAGTSVVQGGPIPYQPWAATKRAENFANRATADPLASCFMPGVPRIMYMEFPFQIFQTPRPLAMTFEWSQVHRLIYTNGSRLADGIDFWMGDSRGRWEGDTLVVDVRTTTTRRGSTWPATSTARRCSSSSATRCSMPTRSATRSPIEDPKVFTRPWKISMPLHRAQTMDATARLPVPGRRRRGQRRVRARAETWYPRPCRARRLDTSPAELADGDPMPQQAGRGRGTGAERRRRSAACRTESRICRASTCPTAAAPTTGWSKHDRRLPHAGGARRHRRSAGRQAPDAAVGQGRDGQPQRARARIRRPDGALLRRRRPAFDVRAVAICTFCSRPATS